MAFAWEIALGIKQFCKIIFRSKTAEKVTSPKLSKRFWFQICLTQVGWADWRLVNFLIKYYKSNVLMKTLNFLFSSVRLKSPINIILSYMHVCLFKISGKCSRKYLSFSDGTVQRSMESHFRDLVENPTKNISESLGTSSRCTALQGIFSLI